jgi:hypothetical protein
LHKPLFQRTNAPLLSKRVDVCAAFGYNIVPHVDKSLLQNGDEEG